MRLLTCRAEAPNRQSAPAASAVGRLAVSKNENELFCPEAIQKLRREQAGACPV